MKIVTIGHIEAFRKKVQTCVAIGGDMLALGAPGCGKTVQAHKLWKSDKSPARPAHYYCVSEEKTGQRQSLDLLTTLFANSGKSVRIASRSATVRHIAQQLAKQKIRSLIIDQFELANADFFDDILSARKQAQLAGQAVSLIIFCRAIPQCRAIHPEIDFSNRISMRFGFPILSENDVANLLKEWFPSECSDLFSRYQGNDEEAKSVIRLIVSQFSGRFDYIAQFAALHEQVHSSLPWTREDVVTQIKEFSGLDPQPDLVLE